MKCYVCIATNAQNESIVHRNITTVFFAHSLAARAKRTLRTHRDFNHLCDVHVPIEFRDKAQAPYSVNSSLQIRADEIVRHEEALLAAERKAAARRAAEQVKAAAQ